MFGHLSRSLFRFIRVFLLLLCLPLGGALPAQAQPADAYALTEAVNSYRASLGLPVLAVSPALMVAAQRHVEWMAATYTYSHTGEGGSTPNSRAAAAGFSGSVGENAGGSTDASPAQMIFFWDQSSVHRMTMRMPAATHIGAGFAANSEQRLFILLIGVAAGQSPPPAQAPLAGGTPAIGWTPPPNMVWTTNGETHQGSNYAPAAVTGQAAPASPGDSAPPTAVAYVMPFDQIRVAAPGADGSIVHVVEMGQTLWAIATRYGVEQSDLERLNYLGAGSVLHSGDRLIIRLGEGQAPPLPPNAPTTHTVQPGESLWTIAARYQRSVDELRVWNNWTPQDVLLPGAVVLVAPPATATGPPAPTAAASGTPLVSLVVVLTVSPLPQGTAAAATAAPLQPSLPPITRVAELATPALAEVTQPSGQVAGDFGLRLLLIVGMIGGIGIVVWAVATAALLRSARRAPEQRPPRSGPRRG